MNAYTDIDITISDTHTEEAHPFAVTFLNIYKWVQPQWKPLTSNFI